MSAIARLRSVRGVLAAGIAVRALAWGVAAASSLVVGAVLADTGAPLSLGVRKALLAAAVASGLAVAFAVWWRDRGVLSLGRVALWVEERFPALEYTLVTAIETGNDKILIDAAPDRWTAVARRRVARVLRAPIGAAATVLLASAFLPTGAVARIGSPHAGDSLDRAVASARDGGNRLAPLVAEIVPPTYSGLKAATLDEPHDIRALAGSALRLTGRGPANGVVAIAGADTFPATTTGDRWSVTIRVAAKPVIVRLEDRAYRRIVAVESVADLPPSVVLRAPARDSVLRAPRGRIPLAADAADDFGIASSSFEYIVSSGEGETFTFRSGTLGAVRPNARRVALSAVLSIDGLGLEPGDIIHLRAVARDANDVTGPGVGISETRSLRIARSGEYDSVAVEAAAPSDEDKSMISERMLIMLAEALDRKRPSLARAVVAGESRAIAADQRRLRRAVGEIVFARLGGDPTGEEHTDEEATTRAKTMQELLARADSATNRSTDPIDFQGGESPVVAVNKPLLEAYNAMWDATTQLEVGEPAKALPHMRRALAAIQRARQAERVYLRGAPPPVVVDVANARLKGKDKGAASVRRSLTSSDSAEQTRVERFARAVDLAARDAASAVDSLLILRVEALADSPTVAAALGDAVDALRRGRAADAGAALARARRAFVGAPVSRDSLSRWGVVP